MPPWPAVMERSAGAQPAGSQQPGSSRATMRGAASQQASSRPAGTPAAQAREGKGKRRPSAGALGSEGTHAGRAQKGGALAGGGGSRAERASRSTMKEEAARKFQFRVSQGPYRYTAPLVFVRRWTLAPSVGLLSVRFGVWPASRQAAAVRVPGRSGLLRERRKHDDARSLAASHHDHDRSV